MRGILWTLTAGLTAACAGSQGPGGEGAGAAAAASDDEPALTERVRALEARLDRLEAEGERDELAARIDELEAKVAESEPEREDARGGRRARPERPKRPDPDAVYAVEVRDRPAQGPGAAWVTMAVAYDVEQFTMRLRPTIDELRERYGDDLRVVYLGYPVIGTRRRLVLATCAAAEQDAFLPYLDGLFTYWRSGNGVPEDESLISLAERLDLDVEAFERARAGEACERQLSNDSKALRALGVRGVPTSFINGRAFSGARPVEQFVELIDEELAKAKASGIPRARYYKHIVETGARSLE